MVDHEPGLDGRLWRVEQRVLDILIRLDKIDVKIEEMGPKQDERAWRINLLEERLESLMARPTRNGGFLAIESTLIKTIVYGLLAMVGALATGQFVRLIGLFGSG